MIDVKVKYLPKLSTLRWPFSNAGKQIILDAGFSADEIATRPSGLGYVSTYSMSLRETKLKMNAFSKSTTTIISLRNFTLLMYWFLLKVISVRFFFSWSSQMTTLLRCYSKTSTMMFVLYIISTRETALHSYTFFFNFALPESFWMISKPRSVAIAKYSCVWFDDMQLMIPSPSLGMPSAVAFSPSSVAAAYWILSS